jgi:hypothetical protein
VWSAALAAALGDAPSVREKKAVRRAAKVARAAPLLAGRPAAEVRAALSSALAAGGVPGFALADGHVMRVAAEERKAKSKAKEGARRAAAGDDGVRPSTAAAAAAAPPPPPAKKVKKVTKEKRRAVDEAPAAVEEAPPPARKKKKDKKRRAAAVDEAPAAAAAGPSDLAAAAAAAPRAATPDKKDKKEKRRAAAAADEAPAADAAPSDAAAAAEPAPRPAKRCRAAEGARPPPAAAAAAPPPPVDPGAPQPTWAESAKRADVKSGRFSAAERAALRAAVLEFARAKGHSADDFSWLVVGRDQPRPADVRGLWKAVAAALPHRPVKAVAAAGVRLLHPHARRGAWAEADDAALRAAVAARGASAWKAVGAAVGRTGADAKDRWRELKLGAAKRSGRWAPEEEARLRAAVAQYVAAKRGAAAAGGASGAEGAAGSGAAAAAASPAAAAAPADLDPALFAGAGAAPGGAAPRRAVLDDVDWGAVSAAVGTRTHIQCLEKWYDQLAPSMVARGDWGPGDDRRLLRALAAAAPAAEYEVEWGALVPGRTAAAARRRWRLMAKSEPGRRGEELPALLEALLAKHLPRRAAAPAAPGSGGGGEAGEAAGGE